MIEKINKWTWPVASILIAIQLVLLISELVGRGLTSSIRNLDMWLHLLGMPLVLIALWVLIRGAMLMLSDTLIAVRDPQFLKNVSKIEHREANFADRRENWEILFKHWQPSMFQLLLSVALFAAIGFLANAVTVLSL